MHVGADVLFKKGENVQGMKEYRGQMFKDRRYVDTSKELSDLL
jgi:hypothetical protein